MTLGADDEIAEIFRTEATGLVQDLGRALLTLEAEGPGRNAQEEAYRNFHTLKGMANMAGLGDVARLCHEAEAALAPGEEPSVEVLLRRLDEVERLLLVEGVAAEAPVGREEGHDVARTVAVDVRRLDALLNLAGELTVVQTRLGYEQAAGGVTDGTIGRLSLLVRGLREEVVRARLIPVRTLFSRLPRLVRDAAKATGREVALTLDEGNLELDRAVVERVTGALAHLIQNAVVHGIEPPGERERAGKPRAGAIAVHARRENETAVIEVRDDGRGVDVERVAARAVERGLLTAEEAQALTPATAVDVLLLPGFSTAATADLRAGRGVGLTAARDAVRALGGSLAVASRPGRGTRVTLRLPPSVAVLDTLLARAAGSTVALPLRNVDRILPAAAARLVGGVAAVLHEGRAVPLVSVGDDLPRDAPATGFVVVASTAQGRVGLRVDEILGTHAAILKPLDQRLTGATRALGATVLGNGKLALVLDLDHDAGVSPS